MLLVQGPHLRISDLETITSLPTPEALKGVEKTKEGALSFVTVSCELIFPRAGTGIWGPGP